MPNLDPSTIRTQVVTDLGLTDAQLKSGGASAHPNAELARAMIAKIVVDRSNYSHTDAARMLGYGSHHSITALLAKIDAGDYDAHTAVAAAELSTAAQLKSQLETSVESA